jgi:dihydrofolate synthase/folylpolyglutamate synthase
VDWAVIETGMGGRLDATNVIRPALSVITNISMEHRLYLGGTVEKIASEKAGIIKDRVPVVTGVKQPSARRVIEAAAGAAQAPVHLLGRDFSCRRNRNRGTFDYRGMDAEVRGLRTGLAGDFQTVNAALVCAACEVLRRSGLEITEESIRRGLAENRWPGRLEKAADRPMVLLDGAHNLAAAKALSDYMKNELAGRRITLVCGVLDDKPFEKILSDLCRGVTRVILTRARIDRALPPETLAPVARRFVSDVTQIGNVAAAVAHAQETTPETDVIVIAGSLYVVGEAKAYLDGLDSEASARAQV